jgi:hypothetical protein
MQISSLCKNKKMWMDENRDRVFRTTVSQEKIVID